MAKRKKKKHAKTNTSSIPPIRSEIKGLWIFFFALTAFLAQSSFALGHEAKNLLGLAGFWIGWFSFSFFGISAYIFTFFVGWIGWRLLFNKPLNHLKLKTLAVIVGATSLSMILGVIEEQTTYFGPALVRFFYPAKTNFHLGGSFFWYLYLDLPTFNFSRIVNTAGVTILFSGTLAMSLMVLFKITPYHIMEKFISLKNFIQKLFEKPVQAVATGPKLTRPVFERPQIRNLPPEPEPEPGPLMEPESLAPPMPKKRTINTPKPDKIVKHTPPKEDPDSDFYRLPSADLLTSPKLIDQTSLKQNLNRQASLLEETFLSFGIEAKVGQINCGPSITSFEVHPAIGVKVQKIKTLEDDIALNMEAKSIRIIAPIPGKAAVGIEVPNPQPQEVSFKEMLKSYLAGPKKFKIPVLLGKQVNGEWVMSDLTKMPHCIIAGATGSGKSVCINTIVMTILMTSKPDEVKLVMVDPKKVELTPYTRLPHMLAPVITEPREACLALNWLVKEMERRYEIFKQVGARNIEAFNTRKIDEEMEKGLKIEVPQKLPYLVAIIDELADLMMVSSSDIETPIARIAQMARAVGIHLILATQRPSREVITGLIKANFPTRISFKVSSRINSQIVLDDIGAESLLGNGDMLFLPPGVSHLVRAQGAYIRDEDIAEVVKKCEEQMPPNYVINSFSQVVDFSEEEDDAPSDPLYEQAKEVVVSTGNASTTFLQRKLKLGYARAANLIDQLEARGIVGPQEGAKARKVLTGSHAAPDLFDEELDG